MTKLDRLIHDAADFYRRPFSALPMSEKVYLSGAWFREKECEPDIFADEQGVEAFKDLCHRAAASKDAEVGEGFRLLLISQSGAEKLYEKALEEVLAEESA